MQQGEAMDETAANHPVVKRVRYTRDVVAEITTILLTPVFAALLLVDLGFRDQLVTSFAWWGGLVKLAVFWMGANGVGAPFVLMRR